MQERHKAGIDRYAAGHECKSDNTAKSTAGSCKELHAACMSGKVPMLAMLRGAGVQRVCDRKHIPARVADAEES